MLLDYTGFPCLPDPSSHPMPQPPNKTKQKPQSSICVVQILIGAWSNSHWQVP